jgi:ubiquinone/menaquinone biosynthesis C-methylase UbiE
MIRPAALLAMALGLATALPHAPAQEAPAKEKAKAKGQDHGRINDPFQDPDLDVDAFVKRFEGDNREVYAAREVVVRALELTPGMDVADVGAGTGFYVRLFAAQVGPEGKVYAVDIAPAFLKYIAERAKREGQDGVIATVRGTQDDTKLPPGSVDLVFSSDTYHHLEKPAAVLATIHRALRPGGRLAVIDFDRHEGASDFVKGHIRAPKEVFFQEITAAGFEPVPTPQAPPLRENFFAVFRKVDAPATRP